MNEVVNTSYPLSAPYLRLPQGLDTFLKNYTSILKVKMICVRVGEVFCKLSFVMQCTSYNADCCYDMLDATVVLLCYAIFMFFYSYVFFICK